MGIQEALLALEQQKKTPLAGLLEGFAGGVSSAQDKAFENAKNMLLMQQEMEKQRRLQEQDKQMRQMLANETEQRNKIALGGVAPTSTSPLPSQRLKMGIETDASGYLKPKWETVEPKASTFEDMKYKDAQGKVRIGLMDKSTGERRMGANDPYAPDTEGGITPSLKYQMQKDAEKKAMDEKNRIVPGYQSSGEVIVDGNEAERLRKMVGKTNGFRKAMARYRLLIDTYGTMEPTDRAVAGEMKSLAKQLQLTQKEIAALGVLSKSDIPFIEQPIPGPGMFKMKSGMLGALDATSKYLDDRLDSDLAASGYQKVGGEPDPSKGTPRPDGKIKVSNGKETLLIDPSDLADARKDGFEVAQ